MMRPGGSLTRKVPVAILGATGTVGQRFITLLADHPWFEIACLTASERSAGRRYRDAAPWMQSVPIPAAVAEMELQATEPAAVADCPLAFSALDSDAAERLEAPFAAAGVLVVSNAKSHRMDKDVPLLVPEVNPDHLDLLETQATRKDGGNGGLLTNPNCSTIGLVLALKPLVDAFGVEQVHAVTLQALSGAGVPGVPSFHLMDNLVPFIGGEEEKLEVEPHKILGRYGDGKIEPHPVRVSATCTRVPVLDGHTLCLSVKLGRKSSPEEILEAWRTFQGVPQQLQLPSAPPQPVVVLDAPDAPQPRLHRDYGRGMAATVGRLRPCPLFDYRFITLSHNTIRGAAGGAILVAELAVAQGVLR
jgi:aspartate-semialdehyde dehydrogenase